MSIRAATAVINTDALTTNFKAIKKIASNSKVLAVLKANAYGHGLARIAQALPQADAFGVARIDEALALRNAGITTPIVLLEGFFTDDTIPLLVKHDFQTIVHNVEQLNAVINPALELSKPIKVWLKVDTGMHRLGVNPEQFSDCYQQLLLSPNVDNEIVIISHLACADEALSHKTERQLALFEQLTSKCEQEKSLANSAAIVAWPQSHFNWVRPGLMLYGVSPLSYKHSYPFGRDITPVMTLLSSIISLRDIKAGESVGYGDAWRATKATRIAVIAIGYGDGYPRHAENGTPILINNRIVPLIGRVSMDMITVDLGEGALDKIGDIATLWGEGLPVEVVAQHATTIPYELLCNITRRVKIEIK